MEDSDTNLDRYPPPMYYTFALPLEDEQLATAYRAYKPSLETLKLFSERKRSIFAELFIEDPKLGTLHDLSIRAFAHDLGASAEGIYEDILDERIHYDALDLDLPFENCHDIDNKAYWKRVVCAKSSNKSLALRKDINWKSLAMSLKFAEILENAPAAYFFLEDWIPKAKLISNYINEMHITKLQPLHESYFDNFFLSESDTEYQTPSHSSETITTISTSPEISEVSSIEVQGGDLVDVEKEYLGEEEFFGEEENEAKESSSKKTDKAAAPKVIPPPSDPDLEDSFFSEEGELEAEDFTKYQGDDIDEWKKMRKEKRKAKAAQLKRREERKAKAERRRQKIYSRWADLEEEDEDKPKKKKKTESKKVYKSIFDIPAEDSQEDLLAQIPDKRNVEKFLERQKRFTYDSAYCHHINLSILGIFTGMEELSVSFQPGEVGNNYHPRLFRFSYRDMENLTRGLVEMKCLRVFRLTNSEMDQKKLQILVDGLNQLNTLEIIDLGYDNLKDFAGHLLYDLLAYQPNLKELILDYNGFARSSMQHLARGIMNHQGSQMDRLSLAFNPVTNEGLEALSRAIVQTGHFQSLNLAGTQIDEKGLSSCIAWQLIHFHQPLRELILVGVEINPAAGNEILKALARNYKILKIDRRNTNIDYQMDEEIEILLARNKYMLNNPYVMNEDWTNEEIKEFTERIKSKILLDALDQLQKEKECLENRPPEYIPTELSEEQVEEQEQEIEKLPSIIRQPLMKPSVLIRESTEVRPSTEQRHSGISFRASEQEALIEEQRLRKLTEFCLNIDPAATAPIEDFNNMTEAQFRKRCNMPGIEQRYFYFKRQSDHKGKTLEKRQKQRLSQVFQKKISLI